MVEAMEIQKGYKKTEVGVIPSDWDAKKLKEIAGFASGTTPRRELNQRYFQNGAIFWVKTMDLNNAEIYDTSEKVTEIALKETSSLKIFPIDTVLIAMYGGFNQIGRTGILKVNASVNQALTAILTNRNLLNPKFLIHLLNYHVDYWKDVASSSRKDPNITSNDIKEFPVSVPSVTEQTVIATALNNADALITQLEKLIAKKRNIKQGAMQELLIGRKRLPGFEKKKGNKQTEVGIIPCDWELVSYGKVFDFLITATYSRSQLSEAGEIKYVHYGDIHTKCQHFLDCDKIELPSIKQELLNNYPMLKEGDVIVVDASEDYEGVGKSVEVKNIGDFKIISGLHTFLLRDKNNLIVNGFKGYIHSNKYVKKQMDTLATGMKVYGVSKTNMKLIRIPLPSIKAEQTAIVQILSDMDTEIEALKKKLEKYKMIKQGMMQNLLTGKIRLV